MEKDEGKGLPGVWSPALMLLAISWNVWNRDIRIYKRIEKEYYKKDNDITTDLCIPSCSCELC